MTPPAAWVLGAATVAIGFLVGGWRGAVLALTVIAFWLLLQFNRTLRVLRNAASAPVGHVDSAVMLHARLHQGLRVADVIAMTRSLGRRAYDEPETYVWRDNGGDEVTLVFVGGRCSQWRLRRADPAH
jgi:hypothetical protein